MLCVSSNHNTVHLFNLKHTSSHISPDEACSNSINSSTKSPLSSLIPDYFSSTWSFAKFHIQSSSKIICCFSPQVSPSTVNYVIGWLLLRFLGKLFLELIDFFIVVSSRILNKIVRDYKFYLDLFHFG